MRKPELLLALLLALPAAPARGQHRPDEQAQREATKKLEQVGSPAAESLLADAATREAVTAVKRAIVEGHRTRDRAALERLYAEDYTALDAEGGVRTKAQLLDALPSGPEMLEGRYELRTVRRWGSFVVASGHGRMVYRNPDGSTRVVEYDSVNVFEQRGGRWWYLAAFLP